MDPILPPLFLERLKEILPAHNYNDVIHSFSAPSPISVRINTLKSGKKEVLQKLDSHNITYREMDCLPEALLLGNISDEDFGKLDLVAEGHIYRQGLSSLLPVVVLDPQPSENVLDFCAAPGSKTTQMAARMNNQGNITAVEAIRPRFYRLKAVSQLLGAANISFHLTDARRFRVQGELFDKILVDAPCSSEGRFKTYVPKTFAYWSLRKIKEMEHKQRGLLLSASRLLAPGGTLLYSTCTFAPEENEGVVDWFLKKTQEYMEIQDINIGTITSYEAVTTWEKKRYNPKVSRCFRVLPGKDMEGFFMARFKRIIR